ncbi:MAG: carboxypeptidase regulatory-like domain-containing protein, partial [Planctomycetaceae bacterium]|nr:carboxypeptidase regulatory-like domain-containing protein [Planctomycetaceae bacterium]
GGLLDLGDLRLDGGRAVEGRVVDEAGNPLPDRGVVLLGPGGRWSGDRYVNRVTRRSDDLGRFRFQGVAPGTYEVALTNEEGNAPAKTAVEVGAERDVLDVVLGMAAGGEVRVLVVDPEGNPIEGIGLNINAADFGRSARSGADGRAVFTGVPRGEARVRAWDLSRPHRWAMEETLGTPATAGGPEVRITLHPASPIRGRVVDAEGKGLEGMQVHYRAPEMPYGQIATSGPDGAFEFSSGAGRPVVIDLQPFRTVKGNPQPERSPFRAEPVTATAPAEGVILRAIPVESDRTLTVRVLDLEERPLPGFLLTLLQDEKGSFPVTDGNGEVRLEGLLAEEIQFGVFAPQAAAGQASPLPEGAVLPAPVKVMPEGQVVTLRLRRGTALPGTVLDSAGAPAAGAQVYVQTEDYSVAQAVADGDGRFRVFVATGVKLLLAHAVLMGEAGPREMKQIRGEELEGGDLVIRLEAVKGR